MNSQGYDSINVPWTAALEEVFGSPLIALFRGEGETGGGAGRESVRFAGLPLAPNLGDSRMGKGPYLVAGAGESVATAMTSNAIIARETARKTYIAAKEDARRAEDYRRMAKDKVFGIYLINFSNLFKTKTN